MKKTVNQFYFDKNGKQIRELDVLKVFHFTGLRGKKHYMYKWVRRDDNGRLAIMHLSAPEERMIPLTSVAGKKCVIADAEIINR